MYGCHAEPYLQIFTHNLALSGSPRLHSRYPLLLLRLRLCCTVQLWSFIMASRARQATMIAWRRRWLLHSIIKDVNKHLRPISLTPILSKIAEDYVVKEYVKPAVLKKIDPRQFGTIPNSCTTHALISMTHNRYAGTDGNGATARVVLCDFRKAFDFIDHNVLVRKLSSYDIPRPILCWIVDFLMDRKQRVKLTHD